MKKVGWLLVKQKTEGIIVTILGISLTIFVQL